MKSKLYGLISVFSIVSVAIASIAKLLGSNVFGLENGGSGALGGVLEFVVNSIILVVQMYLIIGCITWIKPKVLAAKMVPLIGLMLCIYLIPTNYNMLYSVVLTITICAVLKFKLITLPSFVINMVIIMAIQLLLNWLRWDIIHAVYDFPDHISFILINIDQLIILAALYYMNMKVGEKYGMLVLSRKSR